MIANGICLMGMTTTAMPFLENLGCRCILPGFDDIE